MKNYAVLEEYKRDIERYMKVRINEAFNIGYDQGYNDCKVELTEEEAKSHYNEGYTEGYEKGKDEILDTIAKSITSLDEIKKSEYDKGYKDACNDKDLITCKKSDEISDKAYKDGYNKGYGAGYKDAYEIGKKDGQKAERMLLHEPLKKDLEEAYQKGLKHGQELRAKEAECAEACGMKRAWEAARKIVLSDEDGGIPNDNILKIYSTCYYSVMKNIPVQEAIAKLETWEKKQKQDAPEMNVGSIENRDKIVKAIAGLLAAYGEQLWDVVADMQKNP